MNVRRQTPWKDDRAALTEKKQCKRIPWQGMYERTIVRYQRPIHLACEVGRETYVLFSQFPLLF